MRTRPSGSLAAAVGLLAVQAAALLGIGIFLVVRTFGSDVHDRGTAIFGAVIAILGGVVLGFLARAHLARQTWARSPTIVLEILCLPVGWGLLQGHLYGYGVPLILVALAVLVLLAAAGVFAPEPE